MTVNIPMKGKDLSEWFAFLPIYLHEMPIELIVKSLMYGKT